MKKYKAYYCEYDKCTRYWIPDTLVIRNSQDSYFFWDNAEEGIEW